MNLFDPEPFAQIPGQMSLETDAPAEPIAPRLTYREKRERKAERLREWADGREIKATAEFQASHDATAGIPFGQPILVGHHSQRRHERAIERSQSAANRGLEDSRKADDMRSRAENIEAQARTAIYSDDPDAIEQLTAKIARLEAERDRVKAYNRTCKKGADHGDLSLLTEAQARDLATTIRVQSYACPNGRFPAYHLTNLGGNINRLKKRLEGLQAPERGRWLESRYAGQCRKCGAETAKGDRVLYFKRSHDVECEACQS